MKDQLVSLAKWTILILIAAFAFYIVCPKYYFHIDNEVMRANRVTGKVEIFADSKWKNIVEK